MRRRHRPAAAAAPRSRPRSPSQQARSLRAPRSLVHLAVRETRLCRLFRQSVSSPYSWVAPTTELRRLDKGDIIRQRRQGWTAMWVENLAILATAVFTGAAIYVTFVEHPAPLS